MRKLEVKVSYDWAERKKWLDLPLPMSEYERRIALVREHMAQRELSCLLIYGGLGDRANIRYLTNFQPLFEDTVLALPFDGEPMLTTNWVAHGEPMHSGIWMTWVEDVRAAERPGTLAHGLTVPECVQDYLSAMGLANARIGLVAERLPADFRDELFGVLSSAKVVLAADLLLNVRARKSDVDIDMMRQCARIGGLGLGAALEAIRPGVTEFEVAAAAHEAMTAAGAEELAFPTAVVAGPRSGLKHVSPSYRKMVGGDMVFLDMGAVYHGYNCDLSRCTVVGEPSDAQRELLDASLELFQLIFDAIRPGTPVRDLHQIANEWAHARGLEEEYMPKGFGHGLGYSLYERPSLRPVSTAVLEAGMTFAFEPMLVRYNFGTAVIEETVLVTETGSERLSAYSVKTW